MNLSAPFIRRPVATTLLTVGLALAGAVGFRLLPVSPLPQVDYPTIQVSATLPGASPETMASSVAAPLERQFGRIAGVTQMTSTSYLGSTSIVMQFDLARNIDGAARDVQAAINAARSTPAGQPSQQPELPEGQSGRRPRADPRAHLHDAQPRADVRRRIDHPPAEARPGGRHRPGDRGRQLAPGRAGRAEPDGARQVRNRPGGRPARTHPDQREPAQGPADRGGTHLGDRHRRPAPPRRAVPPGDRRLPGRRRGPAVGRGAGRRLGGRPSERRTGRRNALGRRDPVPPARREHHRDRRPRPEPLASAPRAPSRARSGSRCPWTGRRRSGPRSETSSGRSSVAVGLVILVVFVFLRNVRCGAHPERRRPGLARRDLRGDVPRRLQPGQPVAHGAHDRHGLRRRRCHRRPRERHPPHGGGPPGAARRRWKGLGESASPCSP